MRSISGSTRASRRAFAKAGLLVTMASVMLAPVVLGQGCSVASEGPLETARRLAAADTTVRAMLAPSTTGFTEGPQGFVSEGLRVTRRADFRGLGVALPARATDARTFGPGFVETLRFEATLEGAHAAAARLDQGRVVYENAFEDTDEIVASHTTSFESFFLLHSANAPRKFAFHVALPKAVAAVEARSDGLWFFDAQHDFVLHSPQPYAIDRNGARIAATLTWENETQRLTIAVSPREALAYPVLLDPAFETNAWAESKTPHDLASPLLAFDDARKNAVLVTGEQTWLWNGSTWSDRAFPRGKSFPPERTLGAMTFDPVRREAVLFGGNSFGQETSETWLWDSNEWRIAVTPSAPAPRSATAMVFDAARGEVVMFGGSVAGTTSDQTWVWNGQAWSKKTTGLAPSPRQLAGLAYDAKQREVLLFGGVDGNHNVLADTWAWNGSSWRNIAAANAPSGRFSSAMAFDDVRREVLLFGGLTDFVPAASLGDTWTWDGQTWTKKSPPISPPPVGGAGMVFDSVRGRILLVGGKSGAKDGREAGTWSWDGQNWREDASFELPPPMKEGTLLVSADARKELLLYAGNNQFHPAWGWTGTAFERREFRSIPPARSGHALAFDMVEKLPVLFGGVAENAYFGDTWMLSRNVWESIDTGAVAPPRRAYHRLTHDPSSGVLLLFGGLGDDGYMNDTWTFSGRTWKKRSPATSPPPRIHFGMAGTNNGTVVLFGGKNATGLLRDTWEWDGQTWTERFPTTVPEVDGTLMVRDETGATLLQQGRAFRWTGTNWQPAASPNLQYGSSASAAFDLDRQQIVLVTDDTTWRGRYGDSFRQVPEGAQPVQQPTDPVGPELVWNGSSVLRLSPQRTQTLAENLFQLVGQEWLPIPQPAESYPAGSASMAYDSARATCILIDRDDLQDKTRTWAWNGTALTQRLVEGPSVRYHAPMTYDSLRKQVVLFGGLNPTGGGSFGDTWTWDGNAWLEHHVLSPTPRRSGALAFDAARGYVLLFGGARDSAFLQDTWTWDGAMWTERSPKTLPAPRESHTMAFSPELGAVVLWGGRGEGNSLSDTWRWDGTDWVSITTSSSPTARGGHGLAAHPATKRLVLYGGSGDTADRAVYQNPWFFYARGGACTAGADCAMGSCVDGVCCDTPSCGTCETCAGTNPGKCTPIVNGEDPDSCALANRVSCNELAQCRPTIGADCKSAADCGSGFCSDGVCCDSACDRPCESCKAKEKSSGKADGVCGPATPGTNPGARCAAGATCNEAAVCSSDTSASCRDGRFFNDPVAGKARDCSPYRCVGSCLTRCSSTNDCVYPSTCDPSGKCTADVLTFDDSGCSTLGPASSTSNGGALGLLLALAAAALGRRARRPHA